MELTARSGPRTGVDSEPASPSERAFGCSPGLPAESGASALKQFGAHADIGWVTCQTSAGSAPGRRNVACAIVVGVILLTLSALPTGARAQTARRGRRGGPEAHVAVVGGSTADAGTFPWMAYVLLSDGETEEQCSGTVVAPNLVLTAGHCAENVATGVLDEASGYRVVTGNVDWAAPEAERQVSGVIRVIPCDCFDRRTGVGDVALLQLATPTTAPTVALAPDSYGSGAIIAGWGVGEHGEAGVIEQLRWAPTVVQEPGRCEREASPFSGASETCALDTPGLASSPCNGDSGGPLLVSEPSASGGMVEIGVASHVFDNCATSDPAVYTRADAIAGWVQAWATVLAANPPASVSEPADAVPPPALGGIASTRSLALRGSALSLVVGCDAEGGTCTGEVEASVTVRETILRRRGSRRSTSTLTRRAVLLKASFGVASGASAAIRSTLSPSNRALLSRLGGGPLDVLISGSGVAARVATVKAGGRA